MSNKSDNSGRRCKECFTRKLYVDMQDGGSIRAGDFVISEGKSGIGTIYFVLTSRRVKRRVDGAVPRYTLTVEAVDSLPKRNYRAIYFSWYKRASRKKQKLFLT